MGYINAMKWGWKLADINTDGSQASAGQRAYNFATNGGGTITYRIVMLGMSAVLLSIFSLIGNSALGKLDSIDSRLQHVEQLGPAFDNRILNNSAAIERANDGQRKIWDRLNDHEHRITVLEAREAPR